jgi:hypothetical protein
MNEEQKTSARDRLPKSVWGLYIFGYCLIAYSMVCFLISCMNSIAVPLPDYGAHLGPMLFVTGILTIASGISISKRRARAWLFGVAFLIIAMVLYITAHGLLFRAPSHERNTPWILIPLLPGIFFYLFLLALVVKGRDS